MKFSELAAGGPERDFQQLVFDYEPHPDQHAAVPAHHPVVVVGAGPIGLALAIDLAQQGIGVLLLDNDHRLSTGSRAICFSKRSLEIFDRLGCGERPASKGVSWNVGRVFLGSEQVYEFNLLPEGGHQRPAFVNLQQYYVEGFLAERVAALPNVAVRWSNKVVQVEPGKEPGNDRVRLGIETPDGLYAITADWVLACDGSRSSVRQLIGQESQGRVFHDRFLIADVRMSVDFPAERWFWFDPPFHRGQSVLLHRQPDDVWRIDFQLGWDADPDEERKPEHVIPRVKALLDASPFKDAGFTLEWASVYTFACQRMARFRHGRILFAGDSAHGVSPFGARGANSGLQDAENLAWKLAAVVRGEAPDALLSSYARERERAADENILNSTRATDFITPKSEISRLFRDAVLQLGRHHEFARRMVNSGRLSVPAVLDGSSLNTPDVDVFSGSMRPGAVASDGPLGVGAGHDPASTGDHPESAGANSAGGWLMRRLVSGRFTALVFGDGESARRSLGEIDRSERRFALVRVPLNDDHALLARRYGARDGTTYLIRPDQHVCARWHAPDAEAIVAAHERALARR